MGLDNGINVKLKKKPPDFLHCYQFSDGVYEILYWRKHWGVRSMILDILGGYQNGEWNDGKFEISYEQMKEITKLCIKLCNKKFFNDYAESSVFSYEETRITIVWNVMRAWWLLHQMKKDQSIKPYFYDSY